MKMIILLGMIGLGWGCLVSVKAQSSDFFYQIILESKITYNDSDENSEVNPDNRMGMEQIDAKMQLYPVLRFSHTYGALSTALQAEGNITNYNFSKDSTTFDFQELYTCFSWADRHHISFGKKRLNWGTGMIWNPTNFYVQKDPLRTQNRLEGIFQLSYSYLMTSGQLEVYLFPEKKWRDASYALKYSYFGQRIDAAATILQYCRRWQFGLDMAYGGDLFTAYAEGVMRNYSKSYKVNEKGELFGPALGRKQFYTEALVGFSLQFDAHWGARTEYRFREDYMKPSDVCLFENHLPGNSFIYDPISVGQHTLFGSVEWKDLYDMWFLQLRSFYDPSSDQFIFSPLAIWKKNNFQVEVSAMIYNNALRLFDWQGSVLLSCHF